jgi:hypothetical protein
VIVLSETRPGGTVAAFFHEVKVIVFEKKEQGLRSLNYLQKSVIWERFRGTLAGYGY